VSRFGLFDPDYDRFERLTGLNLGVNANLNSLCSLREGSLRIQSKLNQRGERILMQKPITLVDRGRGLQLSISRITVRDLVPYFQDGCSHDEIIRWIPSLTHDEIAIVEGYYLQHKTELDEYEGRIRAYRAEQIHLQRLRFPARKESRLDRLSQLRELLRLRQQENSDEGARR
jgi:Protein of unknown function (DUF433)